MKILVADDDAISRTLLVSILRKTGFELVICQDGAEALEIMLNDDSPQMAVLDWMMPKLDGPDVIRRLREQKKDHPYLILLTNRNQTSDKVAGLDSGANDYVVKPVNPAEIHARVQVGIRFLELQERLAEQSEALLQLERQQKTASLNQMAGGVAHHLNNKLHGVIGGIDLMLMEQVRRPQPDADAVQMLKQIRIAAEEASTIGKKMLTYLSQNRSPMEVLNLEIVCREVIAELRNDFPVLQNPPPPATQTPFLVHATPAEIHEVILQILKNALEADPLHAPTISLERVDMNACQAPSHGIPQIVSYETLPDDRPYIKINIKDNGPGIPADKMPRIFDPFMSTKFTGRGMGLAVCLGIIKKIGGGIRISCPPGERGTAVVVCLPEYQA